MTMKREDHKRLHDLLQELMALQSAVVSIEFLWSPMRPTYLARRNAKAQEIVAFVETLMENEEDVLNE